MAEAFVTKPKSNVKNYWELPKKRRQNTKFYRHVCLVSFKDYLTEVEIVDRLLTIYPNLKYSY